MSTHEYPDGYHVRQLDERVTLESLGDFFEDTGPTGDDSVAWLTANHDTLEAMYREPGVSNLWELDELTSSVVSARQEIIDIDIAKAYIDTRRLSQGDVKAPIHESYRLKRMPTMSRPDIQRLDREAQKRVLQHEVWTEAERLWLIERLLEARGYEAGEESSQKREELDKSLLFLDGMTMEGLADWSSVLQRIQLQLFTVAKGESDKVAVLSTHRGTLDIKEDIAHMNEDELLSLRDMMVRRIEAEIKLYQAGAGPGSPTEKLYDQIVWIESLLNFRFDIRDAGGWIESSLIKRSDEASALLITQSMHAIAQPQNAYALPRLSQNLDAAVRQAGALKHVTQFRKTVIVPTYGQLENYLAALWQVGEQYTEHEAVEEAARILGRAAQEAASKEFDYATIK